MEKSLLIKGGTIVTMGVSDEVVTGDLLIRRDNVFGTPEQDARRRDFTINGLFYDLESGQVIDHVNGMVDLEARVVRTIGDCISPRRISHATWEADKAVLELTRTDAEARPAARAW